MRHNRCMSELANEIVGLLEARAKKAEATVAYAYEVLKEHDNYGSGALDVCVREVKMRLSEADTRIGELRDERDAANAMLGKLTNRVAELQRRGTELENDRRMWNARFTALRAIYETVMMELPVASLVHRFIGDDALGQRAFTEAMAKVAALTARADLLEKDAWTQLAPHARAFVDEAIAVDPPDATATANQLAEFIDRWRARFARALA